MWKVFYEQRLLASKKYLNNTTFEVHHSVVGNDSKK